MIVLTWPRPYCADIKKAAFSADGTTLAVGLETGEVQLCSWPDLKVTKTLGKHSDGVTGVAFSPDGKFLLTTSSEPANKPDKGAAVWSIALGERVRTLSDPTLPANARGRGPYLTGAYLTPVTRVLPFPAD